MRIDLLLLYLVSSITIVSLAACEPVTFYVATNGNDAWSGKQREPNPAATNGPFATLIAARDAIRALKADGGLQQPVEILVREGTYYLSEPLRLSAPDSGTFDCPITYKAFPGEQPILSGGKVITGWRPYEGQIMCAELPEVKEGKWNFRQLFFNGQRQIRARYPNFDPGFMAVGLLLKKYFPKALPGTILLPSELDRPSSATTLTSFREDGPNLSRARSSFFRGYAGLATSCPSSKLTGKITA